MKGTPKSCSCSTCRRGKSSPGGKQMMKLKERSFRHTSKILLNKGKDDLTLAPTGGYFD